MKKLLVSLFACFLLAFASAQTGSPVQILIPKIAYVGDRCELKYVFHSDADLFNNQITGEKVSSLELLTDWPVFTRLSESCFVQKAVLEHVGYEYTLTLSFIPWRSGIIDFSAFDLASLVRASQKTESTGAVFIVDINPVTVSSLVEKMGVTSLRPSQGPMIAPGTTFILIILAVIFLAAASALVYLIIKLPFLTAYYIATKDQRKLKKLGRNAIRQLKKLLKAKIDDYEFCQKLSETIRSYLCQRFDRSFAVLTTERFYSKFEELACGSLSDSQAAAVTAITEVFTRCDYIRFAKGSIDSFRQPASLYETVLGEGEKKLLVNRVTAAINAFTVDEEVQ